MSAALSAARGRSSAASGASPANPGLELSERAYLNAAYEECRHIVRALDGKTAVLRGTYALLEARCAREERDLEAWYAAADRAANDHPLSQGRLTGVALRALASRQAGRAAQADRDFKLVAAKVEREPAAAGGWPAYYAAYDAWSRGAYDAAERLAEIAYALEETRPYAAALLGACAVGRVRPAKAATSYLEALRISRAQQTPDLGLVADTLERASALACEAVELKLGRKIQTEHDAFAWPATLADTHVRTLTNLRFVALLEGDRERAWLLSREAAVRADGPAAQVLGETHAAVASRLLGDERAAQVGIARAAETIRREKFAAGDDDARIALANFAREAASDAPADARKALAILDALTPRELRASVAESERRVRAYGDMAHGRVAEVRGNYDAAYDRYRAAFDAWLALGDRMRAALLALDLQRLARDPLFDETLDAVFERAPEAWFAPEASPASELLAKLTPAETLVLGALLGGKSARAIAEDLDRSVHTINNHTRKIFAAFGVTSRAAVLAHCAELGITAKSLERIV